MQVATCVKLWHVTVIIITLPWQSSGYVYVLFSFLPLLSFFLLPVWFIGQARWLEQPQLWKKFFVLCNVGVSTATVLAFTTFGWGMIYWKTLWGTDCISLSSRNNWISVPKPAFVVLVLATDTLSLIHNPYVIATILSPLPIPTIIFVLVSLRCGALRPQTSTFTDFGGWMIGIRLDFTCISKSDQTYGTLHEENHRKAWWDAHRIRPPQEILWNLDHLGTFRNAAFYEYTS